MFIEKQSSKDKTYYTEMLHAIGSLSRLFSENPSPYLEYRIAENLFCKAFKAKNISRSDCSADASKDGIGIGVKTFLYGNGETLQKIAEFNKEHELFRNKNTEQKISVIAELRNTRLETTRKIYGVPNLLYHCIGRKPEKMVIFETSMVPVDIQTIKDIKVDGNSIRFNDAHNEYAFNIAKSTLYKRFLGNNPILEIPVEILEDPFDAISKLADTSFHSLRFAHTSTGTKIFLPLYSQKHGEKLVPERSGLNQWNASGRPRNPNEVYIPIPAWLHRCFPGFFPEREELFTLALPDGKSLSAKVCQDGSKALMTNPNSALGEWLLRGILGLKERELLTYERLQLIGLDSVVLYKKNDGNYEIDFAPIGSYEEFQSISR